MAITPIVGIINGGTLRASVSIHTLVVKERIRQRSRLPTRMSVDNPESVVQCTYLGSTVPSLQPLPRMISFKFPPVVERLGGGQKPVWQFLYLC